MLLSAPLWCIRRRGGNMSLYKLYELYNFSNYHIVMLMIRLQRVGKKKLSSYRLIISEKARDTKDVYLELLGTYDPHAKENQFKPNAERINYWLSKGAQASTTIHNLLVSAGIVKGKKEKSVFLSKKRTVKVAAKNQAATAAKAAAKEAAEKAAEAAKVAAEPAPVAPQA